LFVFVLRCDLSAAEAQAFPLTVQLISKLPGLDQAPYSISIVDECTFTSIGKPAGSSRARTTAAALLMPRASTAARFAHTAGVGKQARRIRAHMSA
jgi:hypothetical protein